MKFSVLLPTYNRLDLLKYAIASVQRQDYENWELVISDNQSEDNVSDYIQSLADSRIHYSRTKSLLNVTENWNRALSFATGDYVIMLGDDDALMPGYFSTLLDVINQFDQPDWIYTEAYEYACPGVLPSHPEGLLFAGRNPSFRLQDATEIDHAQRLAILQRSFRMRLGISFNMQHSLVKRSFIKTQPGEFYQSLFPDFYATLAGVIMAPRFVIYPEPLIVIGITHKSHGFYFFNDRLREAKSILHTDSINREKLAQIDDLLLPGMDWIRVGWLSALHAITLSFPQELDELSIQLDMPAIRKLIIRRSIDSYIKGELDKDVFTALKQSLSAKEYRRIFLPFRLYYTILYALRFLRPGLRHVANWMKDKMRDLKEPGSEAQLFYLDLIPGKTENILGVVENYPTRFMAIKQRKH